MAALTESRTPYQTLHGSDMAHFLSNPAVPAAVFQPLLWGNRQKNLYFDMKPRIRLRSSHVACGKPI